MTLIGMVDLEVRVLKMTIENYIANEPFIDFETSVEEFERKTCEEMSLFLKEYK